jgi:hypothetical protein
MSFGQKDPSNQLGQFEKLGILVVISKAKKEKLVEENKNIKRICNNYKHSWRLHRRRGRI